MKTGKSLETRAIIGMHIGVIRKMQVDTRPRVQYIHFWRSEYDKIKTELERPELDPGDRNILEGLRKIYCEYPKIQNTDSWELGCKILKYLESGESKEE